MHAALRRLSVVFALLPGLALAHPSPDHAMSFAAGISHPFGGLDHLLAMVAVGILAARLRGHAVWMLPVTFITMLGLGGWAAMGHASSPLIEMAIAGSIVAFGALIAVKESPNKIAATVIVGTFALAHGYAHGTEAVAMSGAGYLSGMLLASSILHAVGICAVVLVTRFDRSRSQSALRVVGTLFAMAGAGLLIT